MKDLRESSKPKEHSEKGNVKREVYKKYIAAASKMGVAVFFLFVALGQAGGILSNYVLRWWARTNSATGANDQVSLYLGAYFVIGLLGVLFSVGAVITIKLWCALRSSRYLHDQAFSALMRSPLSFFELTPTGRILNLFSRDIFVIDEVLVMSIAAFVRTVSCLNNSRLEFG